MGRNEGRKKIGENRQSGVIIFFSSDWQLKALWKCMISLFNGNFNHHQKFYTKFTKFTEYLEYQK